MRTSIGFAIVLLAGCGAPSDPEISACLDACGAKNKCAGAHLADACTSYPSCNDVFGKLGTCIIAYCLAFPLDAACHYQR